MGHFVYAVIALASAFYLTMLVKLLKECGEDREDFRMGRAPRHDGGRTRPYADDECTTATGEEAGGRRGKRRKHKTDAENGATLLRPKL